MTVVVTPSRAALPPNRPTMRPSIPSNLTTDFSSARTSAWTTPEQMRPSSVTSTTLRIRVPPRSPNRSRKRGPVRNLRALANPDSERSRFGAVGDLHAADGDTAHPQDKRGQEQQPENRSWTRGGRGGRRQQPDQRRRVTFDWRRDGTERLQVIKD